MTDKGGAEVYGGSFAAAAPVQLGGNNGRWGYYGNLDYFNEDGWRDFSNSDALRFFGVLSLRGTDSSVDLSVAHAETELRGNGPRPPSCWRSTGPRCSPFRISPRIPGTGETRRHPKAIQQRKIAGNAFYRDIDTDTFNGDGTNFEECNVGGEELLVEEEFTDVNGDGECYSADDTDIELVLDLDGNPIPAEIDGEELNAINNIARREQEAMAPLCTLARSSLRGHENDFTVGTAYSVGEPRTIP